MADQDVNIIGFDGAAPPLWATEQTLEKMLEEIEALVKISEGQRRDLKKGIGGSGGGKAKEDKEKKKAANLLGALSSGLKDSTKSVLESAAGFDNLPGPLAKFGKELKKTSGATKIMALGVGMIANQVGKAVASIGNQVSTLRDLSDSGIQLEGSFMEMSRGLAEVGMTIEQFGEVASKYSRVMSMQGFKSLSELSSVVEETGVGFAKWGMTQDQGIEIAAELLDSQRRAGVFRAIDNDRESKRIGEVMDRLTAYSKVLNVSRETMLENRKELMSDSEVRFRMSQMTEEQRVKMEKGLGGTTDALTALGTDFDWVAQLMKEAAVNQVNTQSAAWQELAGAGFAPLATELANLADEAAASGEELSMDAVMATMKKFGGNKDFLENMFMAGGASKEYAIKIANATLTVEEAEAMKKKLAAKGANMESDAVDKNVQTMTKLQTEINQFTASIEHMRTKAFMDLVGTGAEGGIKGLTAALDGLTKKMMNFSDGDSVKNFGDFVKKNWVEIGTGMMGAYGLMKLAFTKSAAVAAEGAVVQAGAWAGLKNLGKGLGRFGVAGATLAASYYVADKLLNNDTVALSRRIGDLIDWSTDKDQTIDATTGYTSQRDGKWKADISHLSPDQQEAVKKARLRRAENDKKAAAEVSSKAANNATTATSSTTATPEPTMSPSEIAALDQGARANYYAAENLKVSKKVLRAISGEM